MHVAHACVWVCVKGHQWRMHVYACAWKRQLGHACVRGRTAIAHACVEGRPQWRIVRAWKHHNRTCMCNARARAVGASAYLISDGRGLVSGGDRIDDRRVGLDRREPAVRCAARGGTHLCIRHDAHALHAIECGGGRADRSTQLELLCNCRVLSIWISVQDRMQAWLGMRV
jgi:hypothetical protein